MSLLNEQQNTMVVTEFAFCEPVTASPFSLEHIREVGPEGLLPNGGIPNLALCGADVRRGWDNQDMVTAARVTTLASPREEDGQVFLCPVCATSYRIITGQVG